MLARSLTAWLRRPRKPFRRRIAPHLCHQIGRYDLERLEERVQPAIGTSWQAMQLSESGFLPPDSNGDVSETQVLAAANGRIKVFNKAGTVGGLNESLNTFFTTVRSATVSDPHVRYDRLSGRWFVTAIDVASVNRVLIAVSSGSTITGHSSFSFFQFQHDLPGGGPNPDSGNFADYDTLGVDKFALYIGAVMFSNTTGQYYGATGFVVNKADLIGGTLTVTAFRQIGTANSGLRIAQGVSNDDPNATEGYFIGVDGANYGKLDIRRVTNPGSATPSISSTISVANMTGTTFPVDQVAKGSTDKLDSLDDRLFAAMIHRDQVTNTVSLWTAHNFQVGTTGLANNTSGRNGSRWYQIGNLTGTPTLLQAGTLFDATATNPIGYWIPSVAMNGQGHMALASSYASANDFAGVVVSGHLAGDAAGSTQAPTIAIAGAAAYSPQAAGTQRWGDYSQTVVDPSDDMTMWTFQEYCNATDSWAVRVVQILAPVATLNNPNGSAFQGTTGVTLNLTGTGFYDPGSAYPKHLNIQLSGTGINNYVITYNSPTSATVQFDVAANAPAGFRSITLTNPDGQAVTVSNAFEVKAVNPPVLSNIEGSILGYIENDPATQVTATLLVTDPDNANLASASAAITSGFNSAQDVLSFNTAGTSITGSYNSSTGVVSFSGTDTLANYQAVLRSVKYQNTSDNPSVVDRVVTFKVNDGASDSNTQSRTISIAAVNDPPQLAGIEGSALAYTENDAAKVITGTLTVADPDNSNIASATVSITANYVNGEDVLGFTNQNGITGSFDAVLGVLTLTGSATLANYQAALRSVTYLNTSDSPSTAGRTVTFRVSDGAANSNTQSRIVNITAVNDPPVLSGIEGSALAYVENDPARQVTATLVVADPDNTSLGSATVSITQNFVAAEDSLNFDAAGTSISGSYNATTGVLTLTGSDTLAHYQAVLRSVTYLNTSDNPSTLTRRISFKVNDGALDSNTVTRDVTVSAVNDAPVLANIESGNVTVYSQGTPKQITNALTVSDVDSTTLAGATVTISAGFTSGQDDLSFNTTGTSISGSYNASTGVLTLSGTDTLAHYQTVLRTVQYQNTSASPNTATRTITFRVNDGGLDSNTQSRNVTVIQNALPTVDAGGPYTVIEGAGLALNGTASDADGDTLTYSWDINGDGVFGDATVEDPTLTWGQLQGLGIADGPATFNVSLRVDDAHDHTVTSSKVTLTLNNKPPTIALTGNASVNEGSSYTLNLGSITDPGQDTVTGYKINWGDGTSDTISGNPTGQAKTHTYADGPNDYTITVDLTDEDGTFAAAGSKAVAVNDVAPTIALSGNASVNEGATYALTLGAITDPGADTVTSWVVRWGDGQTDTYSSGGNKTHVYADGPNSYTIHVDLTDEDGAHADAGTRAVSVTNVAPTIALSGNASVNEGATYTLNLGAVTDPGQDTVSSYKINWGDGTSDTISGNPVGQAKTHVYADGPNNYTISVDLTDEDGTYAGAGIRSVTVNDVAPTIALTGNASVNEGATYTLNLGAISDPGLDTVSAYKINWGDGTSDTFAGNPIGLAKTHAYADGPNNYTITVDLTDEDGLHAGAGSKPVAVNNVAPAIALSGSATVNEGAAYTLNLGSITDPGQDTVSSYKINWGDGTSDTFAGNAAGQAKTHTYADGPNSYTVTVDLTDEDGTFAGAGSRGVTVNDVPPTIALSGNTAVNEGASYTLTLGAITDPGTDTVTQWIVHWGDGQSNTYVAGGNVNHVYADGPNSYTVHVDLVDEDGAHADAGLKAITVNDVPPTIALAGAASVNEGSPYALTLGAVTDPGIDAISGYRVNWGDGTFSDFSGPPTGQVATHAYVDGPSNFSIVVDLTDEDGAHLGAGSKSVTVNDVPPTIALGGAAAVNEGSAYALSLGTISDPGQDAVSQYRINWGDGGSDLFTGNPAGQVRTHTYTDGPNGYTIVVDLIDEDGEHVAAGSRAVTVNDVPPVIAISGNSKVNEGAGYTLNLGAITDPGVDTVTQWVVHWGDGNSDTFTAGGPQTHTYADGPNAYTVTMDLVDEDGTHSDASNHLAVQVLNVAPTGVLASDGPKLEHRALTVSFTSPLDPSAPDMAAGFRYSFDFNNDGDFLDADEVQDGTASSASHVFQKEGIYAVHGRIKDRDGAFTDYTMNVTVLNADVFVAGTESGTTGQVRVFDSLSGALKFTLTPFGAGYGYGVSVASGDVTGDQIPDVVVGTAGGGLTTVKVYDGSDGTELTGRQFDAFSGSGASGVSLAVGDINKDGFADIVVGSGPLAPSSVRVISGKDGSQLAQFAPYNGSMFGVRVAAGDVNGDGLADIITAPVTGTSPVRVFDGATLKLLRSITPFGNFSGGLFVTAGDVDGDGKAEVIVAQDQTTNPKVRIFNGASGSLKKQFTPFSGVSPQPRGVRVMAVDRDGDGKADIVVGTGPNANGRIRTFKGSSLALLGELTPFDPGFRGGILVG